MCLRLLLAVPAWFLKIWIVFVIWALCRFWWKCDQLILQPKILQEKPGDRKARKRVKKLISKISLCPEILKVIFENSDFGRLKKCRLVCKTWNREICSLTKRTWLAHVREEKLPEFMSMLESRADASLPLPFQVLSLAAFKLYKVGVDVFLGLSAAGFRITKLDLVTFYPRYYEKSKDAQLLIRSFSGTLTHLYTGCWGCWDDEVTSLSFPELKVLQVKRIDVPQMAHLENVQFLLKIISAAPKLISLQVEGGGIAKDTVEQADLRSLLVLELYHRDSDLNLWTSLKGENIGALTQLALVSRSREYSGEPEEEYQECLSRFAGSLTTLRFGLPWDYFGPIRATFPSLPYLPAVTTLRLTTFSPVEMDLSNLPNLNNLIFSAIVISASLSSCSSSPNPEGRKVYTSVQSVSFSPRTRNGHVGLVLNRHSARSQEKESIFLELIRCFPNARAWELKYRNVVNFCRVAPSTGSSVKSLRINLDSRPEDDDEEKLAMEDRLVLSYVQHLTDLEELTLFHNDYNEWDYMRGEGLEKMAKLKVLKIRSGIKSTFAMYRSLNKAGLRIIAQCPKEFNGTEDILSLDNFELRSSPEQ